MPYDRKNILKLYKLVLFNAKIFPSRNRDKIVQEIRNEFRANAKLQDELKIKECIELAERGLTQLTAYTRLREEQGDWSVDLEKNPLPRSN